MICRIKICGITNIPDALGAVEAGADALGFIFHEPSPRNVHPTQAAAVIRELPPFVSKVGVFVNASRERIEATIAECGIDTVQFHGDETQEFCAAFPRVKGIKAFRVRGKETLLEMAGFPDQAWLMDSFVPGQYGGSGVGFNWSIAQEAALLHHVVLAGGLHAGNVGEAIRKVRPYAVDVSSGVEKSPGQKDREKVRAFISAVREGAS
jgi:phosphoribosylanthranilate isomerase